MKHAGKIILLLLLAAALFLLFYPEHKKPELMGHWNVKEIIVDGRKQDYSDYLIIEANRFDVNEFMVGRRLRMLHDDPEYAYKVVGDDSLVISSDKPPALFDGQYKIYYKSKVIGGGKRAYYDITLYLVSKNKTISLYRTENVEWMTGIPRGSP